MATRTCLECEREFQDDNRPENLELWTRPQPTGIRVTDAIAWAREILDRYSGHADTTNNAQGRNELQCGGWPDARA